MRQKVYHLFENAHDSKNFVTKYFLRNRMCVLLIEIAFQKSSVERDSLKKFILKWLKLEQQMELPSLYEYFV